MLRSLLHLATSQPQLLADHLEAYSELLAGELLEATTQWKRRAAFQVLGYCGLALSALLGAIALMLWAVVPVAGMSQPWLLVAVPLVPAAVGLWATMMARTSVRGLPFATLRRQWAADVAMLHDAGRA